MAAATLTKKQVQEYREKNEERLRLQREAKRLEDGLVALKETILAYVNEHGGEARAVVLHGHRLAIGERRGTPPYKMKFLDIATKKQLEDLDASTPMIETLTVEQVT